MVNPFVLTLLLLQPAEQPLPDLRERAREQEQASIERASISRETAERRLTAILASGIETTETVALLRELAERVEDESFAPIIRYNAAVIAMNEPASIPEAQELFRQADRAATDPALRAASRYNLAHTIVNAADAETPFDKLDNIADIEERIAAYQRAERAFRSTLDADPTHADAAKNTERLRQRIQDLRNKRDQLEQQQQALDDLADQLNQLAEQQQQESEENQSRAEQNESNPEQADQQAQQQQEQLSDQTDQAAQQSEQAQAPPSALSAMEKARQAQAEAEKQLEQGQTSEASDSQSEAAEQLRQAAEDARQAARDARGEPADQPADQPGNNPQPTNQPNQDQPAENPDQPGQQPGETESPEPPEVDPIAEALIDKERRERAERMRYLQRTGRQRVERDW